MKRSRDGSIFRAKDGKRWVARLQYTDAAGRRRQKARYCRSAAEARARLIDLRAEVGRSKNGRKTYRELDAFFRREYLHPARFVGGKKVSGFRQAIGIVERYLNEALDYFGDRPIDEITFEDLRRYKQHVAAMPVRTGDGVRSVSDTNHYLKRLRRNFTIAIEQGWLDVSPFARGSGLVQDSFEVERTRVLTAAEETRLLAACAGRRKHLRPIVIFAIETGCRRGEIQSVRWQDVNLSGRFIRVVATSTKTLKGRLVPISDRLHDVLAEQWQNSSGRISEFVFGPADFKKAFLAACRAAGILDVRFHDLRHTAITRMLEVGISPPLVMKISGHTQQKTFMRYVNQTEQSVAEIARLLSRAA